MSPLIDCVPRRRPWPLAPSDLLDWLVLPPVLI